MQSGEIRHRAFMKRLFFTTVLLVAISYLQAQTADQLYGFRQGVTPGTKKVAEIEQGGLVTKSETAPIFQYRIYFTTIFKARIYLVQLWLNGEAFAVNSLVVPDTQLLQEAEKQYGEKPKPIIYKAGTTIYKLTPIPLAVDKSTGKGKALAQANAVVLLYKKGGKLHYGVLKKFTEQKPVALQ
jgi:hypothetical protein